MNIWTTIKVLHKRSISICQISKQLKISRSTIRKYLSTGVPPHYEKTAIYRPKSKRERWKKIIDMYYNKQFVVNRIFEEHRKEGAEG